MRSSRGNEELLLAGTSYVYIYTHIYIYIYIHIYMSIERETFIYINTIIYRERRAYIIILTCAPHYIDVRAQIY